MNDEAPAQLARDTATTGSPQLVMLAAGNLLPSFGFLCLLSASSLQPQWQSGQLHEYIGYFLSGGGALIFFPFVLYAIACFTLSLYRSEMAGRYFVVRCGVYSGVVIGLQYSLLLGLAFFQVEDVFHWSGLLATVLGIPMLWLVAVVVPCGGWWLLRLVCRWLHRVGGKPWWVAFLMLAAPLTALLLGLGFQTADGLGWLISMIVVPMFVVFATPFWMLTVYLVVALRLAAAQPQRWQIRLAQLLGIFTWLAAYLAAWRFAVVKAVVAYSELPTNPPDGCYIATAAAHGHPRCVSSQAVTRHGRLRRVNMQLAYFKYGELALMVAMPRVHRRLRHIYDRVGPPVARHLAHPWASDLAYLVLKPLEAIVRLMLAAFLGDISRQAARIYGLPSPRRRRKTS